MIIQMGVNIILSSIQRIIGWRPLIWLLECGMATVTCSGIVSSPWWSGSPLPKLGVALLLAMLHVFTVTHLVIKRGSMKPMSLSHLKVLNHLCFNRPSSNVAKTVTNFRLMVESHVKATASVVAKHTQMEPIFGTTPSLKCVTIATKPITFKMTRIGSSNALVQPIFCFPLIL